MAVWLNFCSQFDALSLSNSISVLILSNASFSLRSLCCSGSSVICFICSLRGRINYIVFCLQVVNIPQYSDHKCINSASIDEVHTIEYMPT